MEKLGKLAKLTQLLNIKMGFKLRQASYKIYALNYCL